MALLKCEDLTLGYEDITLATGVSFEVSEGEYWCITGENGTGKTTLMKTVLGLRQPLKGKITHGDGLRKNEIGYLPQRTEYQKDFPASVREIVCSGFQGRLGLRPFYTPAQKAEAMENLKRMGVEDLADKSFGNLSGGQQQRVLLARAICATRKMLLMDEPVAGLDVNAEAEMYKLIDSLNKEEKIAIIMVTHDVEAAKRFATHEIHFGEEVTVRCLKH
ncbi:MAG: metal ABC transporter ATP-binding protein [Clostridiales bacterium]|nr:metal ABC transporter ATP-binding protein [Clostridiales bacterium]